MMIEPELFAAEHSEHERIEDARHCFDDKMVSFQYCQDCDLLGYTASNGEVTDAQELALRAAGQVFIIAIKRLADMPPKEGPTTQERIERIWAKVRYRI